MRKNCLVMYGNHTPEIDNKIIAAAPVTEYFVANTKAGMYHTPVTPQKFQAAGIKVFSYGDGGYETRPLSENLAYIDAIADEGCYGFFLDQVSAYPNAASLDYLLRIASRCWGRNLHMIFNTGVSNWSDALMSSYNLIMSNEQWFDTAPSQSQLKWQDRVILLSNNMQTVEQAVARTKAAWDRGFPYHYSCSALNYGMPAYYSEYVQQLIDAQPPVPPVPPVVPLTLSSLTITIPVTGGALNLSQIRVSCQSSGGDHAA
jgi:hypothetical protein